MNTFITWAYSIWEDRKIQTNMKQVDPLRILGGKEEGIKGGAGRTRKKDSDLN